MALAESDLRWSSDAYGYTIFYKGRSIARGGVMNRRSKGFREAQIDRAHYAARAEATVGQLMRGEGPACLLDEIRKIESGEMPGAQGGEKQ